MGRGVSFLPAAAIPRFAVVSLGDPHQQFEIQKIENGTPVAGRIVWIDKNGTEYNVAGSEPIRVIELP